MTNKTKPSVYLYGMITPSTVYLLDNKFKFPEANTYAEIGKTYESIGGEAINSAVILSKLGIKTKFDGNWINRKNFDKIKRLLKPYNVDISRLTIKEDCGTEEFVIADGLSRTVFGNYAAFHSGNKQWNKPEESDIIESDIVALDPYFRDESDLVAEFCVKHNKPYVTLDCRYDSFLAQNAAAIVVSHELRDQAYSDKNINDVFELYTKNCKGLSIFTFGEKEIWFARKGEKTRKLKPYQVKPLDTTGAGDAFRGAITYGLLKNLADEDTIRFASAVAACVCLSLPHTFGAPNLEGVEKFMKEQ